MRFELLIEKKSVTQNIPSTYINNPLLKVQATDELLQNHLSL